MKICISSVAGSLDAKIEQRFGRCPFFIIVDSDTMNYETIPNTAANAMGGAGIQAAQLVTDRGVHVVLTGNIGPNTYRVLSAARVRMVTGVTGTIRNAVEQYRKGNFTEITGPTVRGHFGVGRKRRRKQ
jgi:predicted Fe-Mo cluster-binding NifX family protein